MVLQFTQYAQRNRTIPAVVVTSANRADVAAFVGGSVVDGVVQVPMPWGEFVPAPDGSYITTDPVNGFGVTDAASFLAAYAEAIAGPSMVGTTGRAASTAALAAGGTVDVPVTLRRPMASTDYTPTASIVAGTGTPLSGARVQGIVSWTESTVVVRVQNTGLAAIASGGFTVAVLAAV